MSSRTLLARYEGIGERNAGGILTEGGLVWFIENKDSAISFGGGETKATVLSYTPKQNLNLLNRKADMSKKQADIINEIMMPRFGFSQAEINEVKKGGRYVKGNYPNNRLGDTDVIAGKGRSFENYVSEVYYRDYYRGRVTNPYESGAPYELREAPDESGIISEPVIELFPPGPPREESAGPAVPPAATVTVYVVPGVKAKAVSEEPPPPDVSELKEFLYPPAPEPPEPPSPEPPPPPAITKKSAE